jgi:hypothetical protein
MTRCFSGSILIKRFYAKPSKGQINPKDFRLQNRIELFCFLAHSLELDTTPAAAIPRFEAPQGAVLKNIVIRTGQAHPIALKDEEYPEWVWSLLKPQPTTDENGNPTRATMKKASKETIKSNNQAS